MKKIEFVNNSAPYLSAENLNQIQDNVEEAINNVEEAIYKTILYENADGSNENITLNDSVVNYSSIEIEYLCNTYGYKTMKLDNPNIKTIVLDYICTASLTVNQLASSVFSINGANIILQNSCLINHNIDGTMIVEQGNKLVKITKVIGYK